MAESPSRSSRDVATEDDTHRTIGAQIRERREARGLTLKALAEAVGVTPSLLSQVENDKAQPSVGTLRRVAVHLQLSVDTLLGIDAERPIGSDALLRRADAVTFELSGGVHWERLGGSIDSVLEIVRITYPPGSASAIGDERVRFRGYEFGTVIAGELTLQLGFESLVVRAGDSVHFDTSEPHRYENTTEQPAEGIWFIVRDPAMHARIVASMGGPPAGSPLSAVLNALQREQW